MLNGLDKNLLFGDNKGSASDATDFVNTELTTIFKNKGHNFLF